MTQESPDDPLTSTLNTSSRETSLSDDERCEKVLARFFLDNMHPKDTEINFLSDVTGKSRNFVSKWFGKMNRMNLGKRILERNQIPLAKVYFSSNPKPPLPEYATMSRVLKAEKLAVFRYFQNRRKILKIQSSFVHMFEYSENEKRTLEESFEKYCNTKELSVEQLKEIAREIGIDELKVEIWFYNIKELDEPDIKYQRLLNKFQKVQPLLTANSEPSTSAVSNTTNQIYQQDLSSSSNQLFQNHT